MLNVHSDIPPAGGLEAAASAGRIPAKRFVFCVCVCIMHRVFQRLTGGTDVNAMGAESGSDGCVRLCQSATTRSPEKKKKNPACDGKYTRRRRGCLCDICGRCRCVRRRR